MQVDSMDGLIQKIAAGRSDELARMVLDGATTNETFFFRDEPVFAALRTEVLPALFQSIDGRRKLRIWSAASSTGQEAYSIALLLQEMGKTKCDVEILGTDISWQALERAKQGTYLQFEVGRGLPAAYLKRYFTPSGNDWQLHDEVRSMVRFEHADIRRDLRKFGEFDLILCRNVLIYFDVETKRQIIGSLEPMLHPGGLLVLGCAETVINLFDGLQRKQIGKATFYSF
jgi:chemotaxis protein methyltransferase CheR